MGSIPFEIILNLQGLIQQVYLHAIYLEDLLSCHEQKMKKTTAWNAVRDALFIHPQLLCTCNCYSAVSEALGSKLMDHITHTAFI